MISFIISIVCLLVAISLFLKYNNGKGNALFSIKKRVLYALSIVFFMAFITCFNKAYYCSNIQTREFDAYISILDNILSTFMVFVIAFTFKKRILG